MRTLAQLVPGPVAAYHRNEIANALRRTCAASELYWNAMAAEEFVRPFGAAWSPADNVRHLTRSMKTVSMGLRVPAALLRVLFGRPRHASRSYGAVVAAYHGALRGGGQAGRYAPSRRAVPVDFAEYRREVLERHRGLVDRVAGQVLAWRRGGMDDVLLPHPLLGRITMRELMLFTLYHNLHHVHVVARRRGELFSDATPLNQPAQG